MADTKVMSEFLHREGGRYWTTIDGVRHRDDDDKFAILWNFSSDDDLIMRNICHESFHIAMSVCQFCNMSLGFKVGEDEHAAYIAGFAGDCVSEFINSKNTD